MVTRQGQDASKGDGLRVFTIPSWFPSAVNPLAGVFIDEQAQAIGELAPGISVSVATWGHQDTELSPRHLAHSVSALARYYKRPSVAEITQQGHVEVVRGRALTWAPRLPFSNADSILKVAREGMQAVFRESGRVDLIHAHVSYPAGYVASRLSEEFEVPYVLTEHMGPFPLPTLTKAGSPRPEVAAAFIQAAACIAVSDFAADEIARYGYDRPHVIPNMVDGLRFAIADEFSGRFRFLTMSILSQQKRVSDLLMAIAEWDPPRSKVEFWVAGDGPARLRLMRQARRLGVDDRVRFVGHVARENAPALYRQCHAFVLPSQHESFGVVAIEAAASGLPIIATRCGGPESIVNDSNGVLVDVGDIPALASAMQEMSVCWHMYDSQLIREDCLKRFSRETVVARITDLYGLVVTGS